VYLPKYASSTDPFRVFVTLASPSTSKSRDIMSWVKQYRVGSKDVELERWEQPKMFPFKSMFGLSRENTFLAGGGTPFAWGYTHKAPYNHLAVATEALFEKKRMNFVYEAGQTRSNIQRIKHEVDRLKFYRRPAVSF